MIELPTRLGPGRATLLSALRACLAALGDQRDAAEVAGLTGLAFHLNLDAAGSPASVAAYPWAQELPGMVARLGYDLELVYADDEDPQLTHAQARATTLAAAGLARGVPSLLFGVHLPEFGLVRGWDAPRQQLAVSGVLDGRGGSSTIAAASLGRGDVPVLLLATLVARRPALDDADARLAALRHAVRHARDLGPRLGGHACGLAAYRRWLDALDAGTVDPTGHAYLLHVTGELRAAAAPFVARVGGASAPHLAEAAACYQRVADRLVALAGATPFPPPDGFAFTTTRREHALRELRAAVDDEARAVDHLERALDALHRARATARLRIADATPADAEHLFRYIDEMPLAELPDVAAELRARLAPAIGARLRAKLARADGEVVGLLLYADLADSGAPIEASGALLYLYYAWVARDHRGAGIGTALIDALIADARAHGYDGVVADATDQPIYLHADGFAALGFEPLVRGDDGAAIVYRAVSTAAPRVSIAAPAAPPTRRGPLPVVVAQHRPCPLLALTAANVVAAARRAIAGGAELDLVLRDAPPHEIVVGDRRLPLVYIPTAAAELALRAAAQAWRGDRSAPPGRGD